MKSAASSWHLHRQRELLKSPAIEKLHQQTRRTRVAFVLIPALHLFLCYLCTYLNALQIILLAYCVGSVCLMYIFSNAHELFHQKSLGNRRHDRSANLYLRLATLTDISSGLYLYYKYGHAPHHYLQGTRTVAEIEKRLLIESMDLDPITNFRNLYKFQWHKGESPRFRFPIIQRNRAARFGILLLYPFVDTIHELLVEPIKLLRWFWLEKGSRQKRIVQDAIYQVFFILIFFGFLAMVWQNLNFVLYLFFSRAFFLGFLHPYTLLWVSIHSADNSPANFQPACSIYGTWVTTLCAGINLHVEHHDLPWLPRSSLPLVKARCPEMYDSLRCFHGFSGVLRYLCTANFENAYVYPKMA